MKWVQEHRRHTLEIGGYQVAVISGGLMKDIKWTGEILLPTKANTSWRDTTGSLDEQKAAIERTVKVWFSRTTPDLEVTK